ncbi:MAG: hypothetical protein KJS95_08345 [Gammaproteobacteria bacterium]|nr:hypothetical protein [Gammaproteobacteria bacterium]
MQFNSSQVVAIASLCTLLGALLGWLLHRTAQHDGATSATGSPTVVVLWLNSEPQIDGDGEDDEFLQASARAHARRGTHAP